MCLLDSSGEGSVVGGVVVAVIAVAAWIDSLSYDIFAVLEVNFPSRFLIFYFFSMKRGVWGEVSTNLLLFRLGVTIIDALPLSLALLTTLSTDFPLYLNSSTSSSLS